jgi:cold shock CspA family protein
MKKMFGKIVLLNEDRGFGFIRREDDFRVQVFFHFNNWSDPKAPAMHQRVEFDLGPGFKPGQADQAVKIIVAAQPVQLAKD